MSFMGGLHFWWPKMTGRMYPERLGKIAVIILFLGFNLTFFPQFILGYEGMPRRYPIYDPKFQLLNIASTIGAAVLGIGYIMPFCYLIWSLFKGEKAPANPWKAAGLEWTVSSPPPPENFEAVPVVTQDAYGYSPENPDQVPAV